MSKQATPKLTVGLDVGDRHVVMCWIDREGETKQERSRTSEASLRKRFENAERCRAVLEVGTHSPWISRLLKELGHQVIVANARRVRLIADAEDKDDPVDAELLARLGRTDPRLLRAIQHRSAKVQVDLALLRSRDLLVRSRSMLITHVRSMVKSVGQRLSGCSAESFARRVRAELPQELRKACEPVVDSIEDLTARIKKMETEMEALCKTAYPAAERFRTQVPSVGLITALAYVLTIEDPKRFTQSRAVGAYLGLCRKRRKSGDSDPQLGITKAGDPFLRRLLVQCAQHLLGPFGDDCDLRRWGLQLAAGGRGAKKRAVIAVARKLAVLLHHLWATDQDYRPFRCPESVVVEPALA